MRALTITIFLFLCLSLVLPAYNPAPVLASTDLVHPVRIRIPILKVDAAVESVGLTSTGAMDVPSLPTTVAWFKPGIIPGRRGNSVVAGHVDSRAGPAVFWDLRKMKAGDTIEVELSTGLVRTFVVKEIERYPEKEVPLDRIFGPTFEHNLNLITCSGAFDQASRNYQDRLVVYATLRNEMQDTLRTLGRSISPQVNRNGYPSQYYEKAVVEDHASDAGIGEDSPARYQYGLLVDQLHAAKSNLPVGGDTSEVTYATINTFADKSKQVAPPTTGYTGNIYRNPDGSVFIPFTADLSPGPGHVVLAQFWPYMNRKDLFPRGWLNDIGLPITPALQAKVTKNFPSGTVERTIIIQAFQRTILTYDPANPPEWQVERANIGTDYYMKAGMR